MAGNNSERTLYVGNLSDLVTEDLLYELFLQAGPVVKVNIPQRKSFGFVEFKHKCSVYYALDLMDNISLFGRRLKPALPKGAVEDTPPYYPSVSQSLPYERVEEPFPHLPLPMPFPAVLPPPCLPNFLNPSSMQPSRDLRTDLNHRRSNHMQPSKSKPQKSSSAPDSFHDIDSIPDFLNHDLLYCSNNGPNNREGFSSHRNDREPYHKSGSNYNHRHSPHNYNDRRSGVGKHKPEKRSHGFHGRKGYSNHRSNH